MTYKGNYRDLYLQTLIDEAKKGEEFFIVSSDLGAPCLDEFRRIFPKRFISVGIAEQNMISVSCGLALAGKKVIAYSANPFPYLRAYDQLRNAVCTMRLPITIAGVCSALEQVHYGITHFVTEDYALMRTLPEIRYINVSDQNMAIYSAKRSLEATEPLYLTLNRSSERYIREIDDNEWNNGYRVLIENNYNYIITMGTFTSYVLDLINEGKVSAGLIDAFSNKIDASICKYVKGKKVIIYEEHNKACGLGTTISDICAENHSSCIISKIGFDYSSGYPQFYGSRDFFLEKYGMDEKSLLKKCESIF